MSSWQESEDSDASGDEVDYDIERGSRLQLRFPQMQGILPLQNEMTLVTPRSSALAGILIRSASSSSLARIDGRRGSAVAALNNPQLRSMRLIGESNPRYRWQQYHKSADQLKEIENRQLRGYYERNNDLIANYSYVDRLLDSSLPHNLIQTYSMQHPPIPEEGSEGSPSAGNPTTPKMRRTASDIQKNFTDENTPLMGQETGQEGADSKSKVVKFAILVNFVANFFLLIGKLIAALLTSSLSVIASLVDASLDFLSTGIIFTTTWLMERKDQYAYPIGRQTLEPIGILVFSVIMITSFCQVALEAIQRLARQAESHEVVKLTPTAIAIMASTVAVKLVCYLLFRSVNNSSVQALVQDAMTDVVFNIFSIIFPLLGFYFHLWWLDSVGGLLLSLYVIYSWSGTSIGHIRNLTGASATADERNLILYVAMRFSSNIKKITCVEAYHVGDKLNVECDIILDETTSLKDAHDIGEALQYVIESLPIVDRAFVHLDYSPSNPYGHLNR